MGGAKCVAAKGRKNERINGRGKHTTVKERKKWKEPNVCQKKERKKERQKWEGPHLCQ